MFLASAQERPSSPVFKENEASKAPRIFRRSTATYQMWQLFVVMRSANAGDPLAQHELGLRYLTGEGVPPDTVKAAYWIGQAAKQWVIPARYNLAILDYYGWGVPWNPFEAYNHFLYCAKQEMREAQYVLGQFLTDNLVVPRDYQEARRWLKRAAEAEYEPAKKMLERFDETEGTPDTTAHGDHDSSAAGSADTTYGPVFIDFTDTPESNTQSTAWLKKLLESGSEELEYAFGKSLSERKGKEDSVGTRTVIRSAEAGSPEALILLGRMYETGTAIGRDDLKASIQYMRATRLGSQGGYQLLINILGKRGYYQDLKSRAGRSEPEAQYAWAMLTYLGLDYLAANQMESLTDAQALHLLEQSAGKRYLPAMVELGICYYSGRWVPADRKRGLSIWTDAEREWEEQSPQTSVSPVDSSGAPLKQSPSEAGIRKAMAIASMGAEREDLAEAMNTLREGESVGSLLAEVGIGYCHENGIVVPPSKGNAARYYRKAAYRGSQDAYYALKRMYDEIRPPGEEYEVGN